MGQNVLLPKVENIVVRNFSIDSYFFRKNKKFKRGPWWSSGLERHSFVQVMLKVEGSNLGHSKMFIFVSECRDKNDNSLQINQLIQDLFNLCFRNFDQNWTS